jgi:chromosome segregation ATPase
MSERDVSGTLAGQPEAPKGQEPGDLHWHPDLLTPEQTALVKRAERAEGSVQRANGRAEDLERDLAAAKAQIAKLESTIARQRAANRGLQRSYDEAVALFQQTHGCHVSWVQRATECDAAKAKLAEVTLAKDTFFDALQKTNARADAAERRADDATKLVEHTRELHNICDRGLVAAWAERDQLAARVCTTEERAVLDAWGLLLDSALEYLRVNGSIPLSNIAVAELANRAAKAKAGA